MSIWIQITAGDGPAECCYAVTRIADLFCSNAKDNKAYSGFAKAHTGQLTSGRIGS